MDEFHYEEYDLDRRILDDFLSLASEYRLVKGAYDIDFSSVYAFRAGRPADRRPSILACFAYAIGQVLPKYRRINSHLVRFPRKRLAIFDTVDISIPIDYVIDGKHVARARIIRSAERLSLDEIRDLIEAWQREREQGQVPAHEPVVRWLFLLPRFVRRLIWNLWIDASPQRRRALLGTCSLSCVASGVHHFSFHDSPRTLYFDLGPIAQRPVVRNGNVTTAPVGRLVRTFDHRIIDGYEATEFLKELVDFLEHFDERVTISQAAPSAPA